MGLRHCRGLGLVVSDWTSSSPALQTRQCCSGSSWSPIQCPFPPECSSSQGPKGTACTSAALHHPCKEAYLRKARELLVSSGPHCWARDPRRGCRQGGCVWTAPHVPLPLRAGFESPAGPTPSPSAPPAPPWQGRSVASSKLWMLEFSAFLEQQQDPDTVGAGPGLAGSLTHSCSRRRLCLQLFPHLLLASCPGLLPHSTSGCPQFP